jgi:hypothetical protein
VPTQHLGRVLDSQVLLVSGRPLIGGRRNVPSLARFVLGSLARNALLGATLHTTFSPFSRFNGIWIRRRCLRI